ncbi:MAG: hypothetical protein IJU66_06165 [Oscillospiraceae bacterium]|nr:hypothetical protein [Oscillospiraceae bacterium]
MYNRYIRNERGDYVCISVPTPAAPPLPHRDPPPPPPPVPPPPKPPPVPPPPPPDASRFISRLLKQLRLQDIDSGDLLLLLILFFLFEEKADEEVLIALGLLLIL